MLTASSFGLSAIMLIQAGISAILVMASSLESGWGRISDAAVGGVLGLIVSQILFTPNPVRMVKRALRAQQCGLMIDI
jgi:uncharacterized membrane protein YgaE (UPF0421/DUF939 family)